MSTALRLSTMAMLGAGGLFTGAVVWYAWERVWIWRRLSLRAYAIDFRRSVRKADPALPILLVISAAGAAAFASLTSGAGRAFAVAGIALLTVTLVSSIVIAEPINSRFRRLPEGVVPRDAHVLRRRWRRFPPRPHGPDGGRLRPIRGRRLPRWMRRGRVRSARVPWQRSKKRAREGDDTRA